MALNRSNINLVADYLNSIADLEDRAIAARAFLKKLYPQDIKESKTPCEQLQKDMELIGPKLLQDLRLYCAPTPCTLVELKQQYQCEQAAEFSLFAEICSVAINRQQNKFINDLMSVLPFEYLVALIQQGANPLFNLEFFSNIFYLMYAENRLDLLDVMLERKAFIDALNKIACDDRTNAMLNDLIQHLLDNEGESQFLNLYTKLDDLCFPLKLYDRFAPFLNTSEFRALICTKKLHNTFVALTCNWAIEHNDPNLFKTMTQQYFSDYPFVWKDLAEKLLQMPLKKVQAFIEVLPKLPWSKQDVVFAQLAKQKLSGTLLSVNPDEIIDSSGQTQAILVRMDAAGAFSPRYFDSYHAAEILYTAMMRHQDETVRFILDSRRKQHFLNHTESKVLDENNVFDPAVFFKAHKVNSFEKLIALLPQAAADDPDLLFCVVFNALGYPEHEKILKDQMQKQDEKGRLLLHYLVQDPRFNLSLSYLFSLFDPTVVEALMQTSDKSGLTPVHTAMMQDNPEIVATMTWDKRCKIIFSTEAKLTPIDLICRSQMTNKIKLMQALFSHSPSAKKYFADLYGVEVLAFKADKLKRLFTLHAYLSQADKPIELLNELRDFIEELAKTRHSFLPGLRMVNMINFMDYENRMPFACEAKLAPKEKNAFLRAGYLASISTAKTQLAAIDIIAGLEAHGVKLNHIEFSNEVTKEDFQDWLTDNLLRTHFNVGGNPSNLGLSLVQAAETCGFKNTKTFALLLELLAQQQFHFEHQWDDIVTQHQGSLANLFIANARFLPESSLGFRARAFDRMFQSIAQSNDLEKLKAILNNVNLQHDLHELTKNFYENFSEHCFNHVMNLFVRTNNVKFAVKLIEEFKLPVTLATIAYSVDPGSAVPFLTHAIETDLNTRQEFLSRFNAAEEKLSSHAIKALVQIDYFSANRKLDCLNDITFESKFTDTEKFLVSTHIFLNIAKVVREKKSRGISMWGDISKHKKLLLMDNVIHEIEDLITSKTDFSSKISTLIQLYDQLDSKHPFARAWTHSHSHMSWLDKHRQTPSARQAL